MEILFLDMELEESFPFLDPGLGIFMRTLGFRLFHILLLSHNQLPELDPGSLASLTSLSSLSLDHNRLTLVPPRLFQGCPLLQDLALNNNYLDDIPSDISSLAKLRTLDLGENRITAVAAHQLENLGSLYGLRLAGEQNSSLI